MLTAMRSPIALWYPGTRIPLLRGGAPDEPPAAEPAVTDTDAEPSPEPAVEFELPDDSGAGAPVPSDVPPVTVPPTAQPPAPPVPQELQDVRRQNLELSRLVNDLRAQFTPLIDERTRRLTEAAAKPPVDIERLRSGEATAEELLQYNQWLIDRGFGDLRTQITQEARRASSEAEARGRFNPSEFPGGLDYDTLRTKHLEPAYQGNPALRGAVAMLHPDNPSVAEMYTAAFLELRARHQGNDVAALKAIFNAAGTAASAQQDVTAKIQQAAERGAAQILRDQTPGTKRIKIDEDAMWNMSDQEFHEFERRHGSGM